MPFIDFSTKKKVKIWEGITGYLHHSEQLTFGHITLEAGVALPEHSHVHEQWTHIIAGELEFTVNGETAILRPGMAAFIPSFAPHSAKALSECRVIDCFLPVREDFIELEKNNLNMIINIKKATLADVSALNSLVNGAYRGDSGRQGWTTEADLIDGTRLDESILEDLLKRGDTTVLTYWEENTLLGCVELRKENDKLYLGMLSVRPNTQGKGIGKKLLHAAEVFANENKCTRIFMTVISVRKELIDWYVRHGYQLTGDRKPFVAPDERWGIPRTDLEFVFLEKKL